MSCDSLVILSPCPKGSTWDGLTDCSFSSDGTAFGNPLDEITMDFYDEFRAVGLSLSSGNNEITIDDDLAWEFTVLPVSPMTLDYGIWNWSITTTDSAGVIKTRLFGTIEII